MLPRFRTTLLPLALETIGLTSIGLLGCSSVAAIDKRPSTVVCRDTLSTARRNQLSDKLQKITGWHQLHFDQHGVLLLGDSFPSTGSQTARELLERITLGSTTVILEDASKRPDVAFSRVIPGKWTNDNSQQPVYVVLIDFSDFDKLIGDRPALDAFNVGWALLHEFDHMVHNSVDAETLDDSGECEAHINQMRKECNLPQRTQYFFTPYAASLNSDFPTSYVRLPFELISKVGKKKRYWLVCDATSVGLGPPNQSAAKH